FGDVAGDLGEADQAPVIVVDRIDDHVRPEQAAVLAAAQALLFIFALLARLRQRAGRLAAGPVLIGVEAREMLADALARPVALDPLRAGVPAGDAAFDVEHEDRIIVHALDEHAELLRVLVESAHGAGILVRPGLVRLLVLRQMPAAFCPLQPASRPQVPALARFSIGRYPDGGPRPPPEGVVPMRLIPILAA